MRALRGQITQVVGDPPKFNGEPVNLSLMPDVPMEQTIEAHFNGDLLVDWQYDLTSWPERDRKPWHIAIAWKEDRHDPEEFCKHVRDRLRQIGQGRWDVQVRYFRVEGMGGIRLNSFDYYQFRRWLDENHPEFDYTHTMVVGGWSSGTGVCGEARAGGTESQTFPNCGPETAVHELMHNGVDRHAQIIHSGTPDYAYGERDTLQGYGSLRDDVNALHLLTAVGIEDNNVKTLHQGDSDEFFLVQASADPLSLAPGEDKIVICTLGRRAVRKLAVSYYRGTVRIHRPGYDYSELWRQTTMLVKLQPGQIETIEGVLFQFIEAKNGAAKVLINHHDVDFVSGAPSPEWVTPENAHPITSAIAGIWNNPAWSDQGVLVNVVRNTLVAHWIGWSRLGYKHRYFWIQAPITDNYARGTLYTTDDSRKAVESGEATIHWYDENTGILRAWSPDMGRFAVPLHRLGQGVDDPLNGYYGLGGGEGMAITRMSNGQLVGYHLHYDDRGEQLWDLLQGTEDRLGIYPVTGGMAWVDTKPERDPEEQREPSGFGSLRPWENGQHLMELPSRTGMIVMSPLA